MWQIVCLSYESWLHVSVYCCWIVACLCAEKWWARWSLTKALATPSGQWGKLDVHINACEQSHLSVNGRNIHIRGVIYILFSLNNCDGYWSTFTYFCNWWSISSNNHILHTSTHVKIYVRTLLINIIHQKFISLNLPPAVASTKTVVKNTVLTIQFVLIW